MIDIVIVNWNAGQFLKACLDSIASNSESLASSIVVVDNGSSDGSEQYASNAESVRLIEARENLGFGRACNLGAEVGTAEFILFLNPDAKILSSTLKKSIAFMQSDGGKNVGICGVQLLDEGQKVSRTCSRFPSVMNLAVKVTGIERLVPKWGARMNEWDHSDTQRVDQVMGAYFFVRRGIFEDLGGFDERFFVYYEEVDFSRRCRDEGWDSWFLADAQAVHHGGGSSEQIKARRMFYSHRSRIQYARKHFRTFGFLAVVIMTLAIEPLSRIALSLTRFRINEVFEVLAANKLLLQYTFFHRE